jgi:hypothetical protein
MMKAERRNIYIPQMLMAILALGMLIYPGAKALSADSIITVPSHIINELRPAMEFKGGESREPFMDTLSQTKEPGPAAKPLPKQQKPALPALTMQGVIWGSQIPCIIINNKVLKEGEIINDVKIVKIGKEGIDVSYKGWDYSLSSPAVSAVVKNPEGGEK